MKYEVHARLFFDEPDEARDFFHDCEIAYPKSITINPDSVEIEKPFVQLIENHHDQDPLSPCVLLKTLTPTSP